MSNYRISQIYPDDKKSNMLVNELLLAEGIRRDANLDYTCAMFDEEMNVIATGSCFYNTFRCMAVSRIHQGEGLMNEIVSHLMEVQFARGNTHLFLYTKCDSAEFFRNLGFYEIACIDNRIVFMENKRTGFENYLQKLSCSSLPCQKSSCHKGEGKSAAVIMNANPFTLGHQYLVEKAASENDILHLFIISEDSSLIPFHIRKKLVIDGTSYITNICYHDSGPYMISNATFPSYFQKDEAAIIESHALLDLEIFTRIAQSLNITKRYVGEEPVSLVTGIYNSIMQQKLPEKQIDCVVVPRKSSLGKIISASLVRKAIKENDDTLLKQMLPRTSLDYLLSEEAKTVVESIQNTEDVVHY